MRNGLLLLAAACLMAGCSVDVPNFLGREGGAGTYTFGRKAEEKALPVPVPVTAARVDPALYGVVVVVDGLARTQGFHSAALDPIDGGNPDAAGVIGFRFVAVPPAKPGDVGPAQTRLLSAGLFLPNLSLRQIRAVRIVGENGAQTLPLPAYAKPRPVAATPAEQ